MVGFLSRYKKMFGENKYDEHIQKTIEFLSRDKMLTAHGITQPVLEAEFIDGFHTGYILEGLSIAKLNGVHFR
jgi:hypothetical protein